MIFQGYNIDVPARGWKLCWSPVILDKWRCVAACCVTCVTTTMCLFFFFCLFVDLLVALPSCVAASDDDRLQLGLLQLLLSPSDWKNWKKDLQMQHYPPAPAPSNPALDLYMQRWQCPGFLALFSCPRHPPVFCSMSPWRSKHGAYFPPRLTARVVKCQ